MNFTDRMNRFRARMDAAGIDVALITDDGWEAVTDHPKDVQSVIL